MRNLLIVLPAIAGVLSCTRPALSHPPVNWQNLDLENDGVFGMSTEKAYSRWLKDKKPKTVIVAVLDTGIDTAQEDLQSVLWTDPMSGSHGWNYLGPEVEKEDVTQLVADKQLFCDSLHGDYERTLNDYELHVGLLEMFMKQLGESKRILEQVVKNIGKTNPSLEDFKQYRPRDRAEKKMLDLVLSRMQDYPDFDAVRFNELDRLLERGQYHLAHGLNRSSQAGAKLLTGYTRNNTDVSSDAIGLVEEPLIMPGHGTHLSGIIAAIRNNGKGIDGIADQVRIMMLKLASNIRELRDADLASAIRFAVDHGARVISMSFGKAYTLHKEAVDSATRYAMSAGVLIVHSAGNSGINLDARGNFDFPSSKYLDGGIAPAWITVGASGFRDDSTLAAPFSNYGHTTVDVFAPGVEITSTLPHSRYASWDGTSEATPVVAGLAALLWEYYPALTAVQVKDIIMKTVVKREPLKDKCVSGGVINAYNALALAADLNGR